MHDLTPPPVATHPGVDSADFRRLRAAFATSTLGSWLAYGALPLVAVLLLDASPLQMSLLFAGPTLVGGLLALPLGPMVEGRLKRPVMVAADLTSAGALLSIPLAAVVGRLTFAQLVVVELVTGLAQVAFVAASGANLKALVGADGLDRANSSFEQITWSGITVGPPVGGLLVSLLGPVVTVVVDAVSYTGSALFVSRMRSPEPEPEVVRGGGATGVATAGLRYVWQAPLLRALFLNSLLFSGGLGVVIALEALYALDELGFAPWQFGLVVGLPAAAGILGARWAPRLAARYGRHRVLLVSGAARTPWAALLALLPAHTPGVVLWTLAMTAELLVVGVFNPTFATTRMLATRDDHMARVGATWAVARRVSQPLFVVAGGLLATATSVRVAIGVGGVLAIGTVALLPWRVRD